ncbi:hypothetical protein FC19_GL002259 [Liquorilactobacillus aquaticus DSM 21051]|uniref:UDP-N-acetylglucosamine kinase n=1 Tax=Liquorilactobacillus aquaticus DSM 21051 TaxID=1423725 RepID=A0A0R2D4R6_9LACO|nr:AAA family ATPase [Liquorilactobacillus aquaticus]KRM95164.1 hypothetical protein FC19_GL002259 [Liquorilactobacillus aquaticus DSM 21051]
MQKIILLRGNSGSGKTTTARAVKEMLSPNALLLSQDVLRREMLAEPDHAKNKSISLLENIIDWGANNIDYVIVEGIFKKSVYKNILLAFKKKYGAKMLFFYFDTSFEETLARNSLKSAPFSRDLLMRWWQGKDLFENEDYVFTDQETPKQRLAIIKGFLD